MIRHIVLFRWQPGTTAAQLADVRSGLAALRDEIPGIVDYRFGDDAGINDGNLDFAVTADFATFDDYVTYRDHPAHAAFISEHIRPIVAERCAVQLEL